MSQTISYASPRSVDRIEDCYFYHKMDIPGAGVVDAHWDLRSSIDDYLGRFDFRGKRALDVGTAGGYLTFAMEQKGGDVVSFDMIDGTQWDVVPSVKVQDELEEFRKRTYQVDQRLKNAYWFAHSRLKSKARAYYGDIYDLPGGLGAFDVAVFGMILSHLRDPFQALYSVSRLVSDTIIITNQMTESDDAMGFFIPAIDAREQKAWWSLSSGCIARMLGILGFEVKSRGSSTPLCVVNDRVGPEKCVTLVAKRVAGSVCLTGSAKPPRIAA
jgi:2-polyprenyl-3-methyl-5-hydroxy-6-metoxy-1,4-benzoquinol methylase